MRPEFKHILLNTKLDIKELWFKGRILPGGALISENGAVFI